MRFICFAIVWLIAQQASACPICMPLPQRTAADRLLAAEVVAFGKIDPDQPFAFLAAEVLKGRLADLHIDMFADSTTRRQLAADPNQSVILARTTDGWQNLGIADREYQQIIRRIMVFAPEWLGPAGSQSRLEYFLSLWNHENRAIAELAYLELAKAPYSWIKKVGAQIPVAELQPILTQRDYFEWRSLAILLLAQHADSSECQRITTEFTNCAKFSTTTNLSAWATAYIEIHRSTGVDLIEHHYLQNKSRSLAEIRAILTALSVQGASGGLELRRRIVSVYKTTLTTHPQLAPLIARDLSDWNRGDLAQEFANILAQSATAFTAEERLTMIKYLKQVSDAPETTTVILKAQDP